MGMTCPSFIVVVKEGTFSGVETLAEIVIETPGGEGDRGPKFEPSPFYGLIVLDRNDRLLITAIVRPCQSPFSGISPG
jgi:hypothetical protein